MSWTEVRANQAYEHYRAHGLMKNGRRFGAPPKPYTPQASPAGRVSVTDPDSKVVKGLRAWIQGYNAQAVTNEHHIVLAAVLARDRAALSRRCGVSRDHGQPRARSRHDRAFPGPS